MKNLTVTEQRAKLVGAIINVVIAFAGAIACIYGVAVWAAHNL